MTASRTTIALLGFVACCLLSSIRLLMESPTPGSWRASAEEIPKSSDDRFAGIKVALPNRGLVGYIGESGPAAKGDYYLAQYALVPLIVDDSPNHVFVVGNFPNSAPQVTPENL